MVLLKQQRPARQRIHRNNTVSFEISLTSNIVRVQYAICCSTLFNTEIETGRNNNIVID